MSTRYCLILCPGKLLLPALQSEMDGRTTPLNKARKATGLLAGRCISSGFLLPMSGLVCPCCRHSKDSHGKTTPRPKWGVLIQLYYINPTMCSAPIALTRHVMDGGSVIVFPTCLYNLSLLLPMGAQALRFCLMACRLQEVSTLAGLPPNILLVLLHTYNNNISNISNNNDNNNIIININSYNINNNSSNNCNIRVSPRTGS